MVGQSSALGKISDKLGSGLYKACVKDNVSQAEALISQRSDRNIDLWTDIVLAAANAESERVVAYCMQNRKSFSTVFSCIDHLCWIISFNPDLYDPLFFLIDSSFIDVNHGLDRLGSLLGIAVGVDNPRKHFLAAGLLQRGASTKGVVDCYGCRTKFVAAASHSDPRMFEGGPALVAASESGNVENVKLLLARGADVNAVEAVTFVHKGHGDIGSPLHKAVERKHVDVVDILLSTGADVSLKDAKGRIPYDIAKQKNLPANVLAKLVAP